MSTASDVIATIQLTAKIGEWIAGLIERIEQGDREAKKTLEEYERLVDGDLRSDIAARRKKAEFTARNRPA